MSTIATVHLLTGAGLVQRHGNNVVAVDDASGDGFAAAVLEDCRELSGTDLVRRLAGRVLDLAPSETTRLGVVTTEARGPLVFLHGDIELRTDGEAVSGVGLVTGIEIALDEVPSLSVMPGGIDGPSDQRTDLADGVVAAAGFHVEFASFPPPSVESPPTPEIGAFAVAETVGPDLVERIDLDGSPPIGPAPTVRLSPAHREALGDVLVLDDGTTIPVAHDMVLGRQPDEHQLVARGGALAVEISDPAQTVSRVHALVALEGWDAHLADLGSANGTFVRPQPGSEWVEVAGPDRIRLTPGAAIRLGDRELVFESHDLIERKAS